MAQLVFRPITEENQRLLLAGMAAPQLAAQAAQAVASEAEPEFLTESSGAVSDAAAGTPQQAAPIFDVGQLQAPIAPIDNTIPISDLRFRVGPDTGVQSGLPSDPLGSDPALVTTSPIANIPLEPNQAAFTTQRGAQIPFDINEFSRLPQSPAVSQRQFFGDVIQEPLTTQNLTPEQIEAQIQASFPLAGKPITAGDLFGDQGRVLDIKLQTEGANALRARFVGENLARTQQQAVSPFSSELGASPQVRVGPEGQPQLVDPQVPLGSLDLQRAQAQIQAEGGQTALESRLLAENIRKAQAQTRKEESLGKKAGLEADFTGQDQQLFKQQVDFERGVEGVKPLSKTQKNRVDKITGRADIVDARMEQIREQAKVAGQRLGLAREAQAIKQGTSLVDSLAAGIFDDVIDEDQKNQLLREALAHRASGATGRDITPEDFQVDAGFWDEWMGRFRGLFSGQTQGDNDQEVEDILNQ